MKPKIHINLPAPFFETPCLEPVWERLESMGEVTRSSCNTQDEIRPYLGDPEALLMWAWPTIDQPMLDLAPNLKVGAFLNVGGKTATAFFERGIAMTEARHGWSPSVAELALGLVLNGLRRITEHHLAIRSGTEDWSPRLPADVDPRERQLTGRSVGLIGFGGVGKRLAELLGPFRTDLRVFDPYVPDAVMGQYGAKKADLAETLSSSDVLVLCAANTGETENLLGTDEIALLPKDAVLVNVARSSLIDTEALIARVKQGDLIVLTDVFDKEPLEEDSVLRTLPNLYGTPHRAGGIQESCVRIVTMLVDDLEAFFAGREMKHRFEPRGMKSIPG